LLHHVFFGTGFAAPVDEQVRLLEGLTTAFQAAGG
jgi:hypothetical protein